MAYPLFPFHPITETLPKDSRNTPEIVNPPSPDRPLHSQTSSSCYYPAVPKGPRIRTPSYPSAQRSPGSRPLPSAGILSAVDLEFGVWERFVGFFALEIFFVWFVSFLALFRMWHLVSCF